MGKQRISRTYSFRRYANSRDPDYSAALNVYVTSVSPDVRTNSNEITYWLDRSYAEYGDEFVVCGFYCDRKIIGFAQMAFLRASKVLFVDYVVLHRENRSHGEYFQLARMIQDWVDQQGFEYDYAVAEVSFESGGAEPSEHSVLLTELFKQMGFGVVHCDYYQPPLGTGNPQSDMRAHLLVCSRERVKSLKRETVIHIVRAVYFEHYARWFSPFLPETARYQDLLNERLDELERCIAGLKNVVVNGARLPHPPNLPSRAPRAAGRVALWPPLLVVLAAGVFCGSFFFLQSRLQLAWQIVAVLFTATLVTFATVFSLFSKDARQVLEVLAEAVKEVAGKRK